MADRRMLSATIAEDEDLNRLSIEAQLLFLMAIPHLDRDGLLTGNPRVLFGRVCPLRDELRDRVLILVNEWVDQGLVARYIGADKAPVLFFSGFMKHQRGIDYGSEKPSRFPPPPGWVRTKAGLVPEDGFLALTLAESFDVRSSYRKVLQQQAEKAGALDAAALADAVAEVLSNLPPDDDSADASPPDTENKSGLSRDNIATTSGLSHPLKPNRKPNRTMAVDDDGQSSLPDPGLCVVGGFQGGDLRAWAVGLDEIGLRAFCVALIDQAFGTAWDAPQAYADSLDGADCQRLAGWLWKVIVRPEWSCAPENPIGVGFVRSMMRKATAKASMAPGEWRDLQTAAAAWAADPGAELFGGVVVPVRTGLANQGDDEDGDAICY